MLRRLVLVALLAAAALTATAGAHPVASASRGCSLSSAEHGGSRPSTLGTTYVLSLRVSRTSCGKGKRVVKAFNACRHRHGRAGRCGSRVLGFKCSENRRSSPVQYQSSTTCKRGGKRVAFKYTQNT